MKKTAILFESHRGHTRNIATAIRDWITQGHGEQSVDFLEISRERDPLPLDPEVDTVFIGAPIYAGRFPKELIRWIRNNREALAKVNWAFFSVSLNAADTRSPARAADDRAIRKFIGQAGLVPPYVASIAGALNYRDYGWLLRAFMKRTSSEAGGPTDTSKDHVLTNWDEVREFTDAVVALDRNSRFAMQNRFPQDHHMDEQMPAFEQFLSTEFVVRKPMPEVFAALSSLETREMKLANFLTKIRTLGRSATPPHESFLLSAERFGNTPLFNDGSRELGAGLVGRFWQLNFGIRRILPREFKDFREPGYAKVISNFRISDIPGTSHSRVRSEMRIHSTSPEAAWKFKLYWTLLGPGIRLYMRSALRALRRRAERSELNQEIHEAPESQEKRTA